DGDELPRRDLDVDPADCGMPPVLLMELACLQNRRPGACRGRLRGAQVSFSPHPAQKRLPAGFTKSHPCGISPPAVEVSAGAAAEAAASGETLPEASSAAAMATSASRSSWVRRRR